MTTTRRALAVAVAALALWVGGCGGDPAGGQDDAAHHDHGGGTSTTGGEFDVGLGGPVSLSGKGFELTYAVVAVDVVETDDAGESAADQDLLVVASVEVRVYQGSHDAGDPDTGFELCFVTDDGTAYPRSEQPVAPELTGTVSAGDTLTGNVVFAVPAEAVDTGRVRLTAAANGGDQTVYWNTD